MSFRFWRRIRIRSGVILNLNKAGGSLLFGPRSKFEKPTENLDYEDVADRLGFRNS